jgi:sterol desaturase/sphingolipid hydroxylase (fatty acid hydroxylase superfamily)
MTEFEGYVWSIINADIRALEIIFFACAVCAIFERIRPAVPDAGLTARLQNIYIFSLTLFGLVVVPGIGNWIASVLFSMPPLIEFLVPDWKNWTSGNWLVATVMYAFVWDFFQYWFHRAQHAFPMLWKFHRVHHSDPAMNASTAVRQSFGSEIMGYFVVSIPAMAVCGGEWLPLVGQYVLFSGWGYLNHANIKIPFGPVTWLLSGPQLHRLHHGKEREYHDTNYAAFFPVFDLLFGTLKLPQKNEWPETGIADDTTPKSAFAKAFFPWRDEKSCLKLSATSADPAWSGGPSS